MGRPKKSVVAVTKSPPTGELIRIGELLKIAVEQKVDVDQLQTLTKLYQEWQSDEAEKAFDAAMNRVQAKLPVVDRTADNLQTGSKYAKHEQLIHMIRPIYTSEGFSLSFSEGETSKADHIRINGVLRHKDGHKEHYSVDLPIDIAGIKGSVNKTLIHGTGSTLTYGRRYLTLLMFDVATGEDNDAQSQIEFVSDSQANTLQVLIDEVGADKDKFLSYLASHGKRPITSVSEIPANMYKDAVAALEHKKRATKNA